MCIHIICYIPSHPSTEPSTPHIALVYPLLYTRFRCSVAYRHAIEANPQFPFNPEDEVEVEGEDDRLGMSGTSSGGFYGMARPASSITLSFAPALLFLQVGRLMVRVGALGAWYHLV